MLPRDPEVHGGPPLQEDQDRQRANRPDIRGPPQTRKYIYLVLFCTINMWVFFADFLTYKH